LALFLFALSFLFNFLYGVLLPLVPHLNGDDAGWAFTAFLLFKLIWFIPAGYISDRIGHGAALSLTLALQSVALVVIALFPNSPWFGRALEGMALAQGTLSTFAFLRVLTPDAEAFRGSVAKLLGLGGLGMIAGPAVGYLLLPYGAVNAVLALAALNAIFFLAQIFFFRSTPKSLPTPESNQTSAPKGGLLWFAIGLTAAKAVAVGWEPNLAWWAQDVIHLSAEVAGLSFLVLGLSFVLGSMKPLVWLTPLAFLGFAGLEYALSGHSWAWWPALAFVGFWYGVFVTIAVGRLGWNDPEKIGRHNSIWMLGTDLPMTFVPAILWAWRGQEAAPYRWILGISLLLISSLALFYGLSRDSRAPTHNYQS
jgi:MFS family permease